MGFAVAEACWREGADVVVVHGPTGVGPPPFVTAVAVRTPEEMAAAVREEMEGADQLWMAAAVSDWRPIEVAGRKLKKSDWDGVLRMEKTEDILARAAVERVPGTTLVGFALETERRVRGGGGEAPRQGMRLAGGEQSAGGGGRLRARDRTACSSSAATDPGRSSISCRSGSSPGASSISCSTARPPERRLSADAPGGVSADSRAEARARLERARLLGEKSVYRMSPVEEGREVPAPPTGASSQAPTGAALLGFDEAAWEAVRAEALVCTRCDLCTSRTTGRLGERDPAHENHGDRRGARIP